MHMDALRLGASFHSYLRFFSAETERYSLTYTGLQLPLISDFCREMCQLHEKFNFVGGDIAFRTV